MHAYQPAHGTHRPAAGKTILPVTFVMFLEMAATSAAFSHFKQREHDQWLVGRCTCSVIVVLEWHPLLRCHNNNNNNCVLYTPLRTTRVTCFFNTTQWHNWLTYKHKQITKSIQNRGKTHLSDPTHPLGFALWSISSLTPPLIVTDGYCVIVGTVALSNWVSLALPWLISCNEPGMSEMVATWGLSVL